VFDGEKEKQRGSFRTYGTGGDSGNGGEKVAGWRGLNRGAGRSSGTDGPVGRVGRRLY
jgi:hypothetical protein